MTLRVLLVEDDGRFAALVREMLSVTCPEVELDHVPRISAALARLVRRNYEVIVADLTLPDSDGAETVRYLQRAAPDVPLVVLSGETDIGMAIDVIHEGAADFMAKGAASPEAVARFIRVAAERGSRHRDAEADHDRLVAVGEHLAALAERLGLKVGVVVIDVGQRPEPPPGWHRAQLQEVGVVLRRALRRCDVISRSGDHQLALALVTRDGVATVLARIHRALSQAGLAGVVRIGAAVHHPERAVPFGDLVEQAAEAVRPVGAGSR